MKSRSFSVISDNAEALKFERKFLKNHRAIAVDKNDLIKRGVAHFPLSFVHL